MPDNSPSRQRRPLGTMCPGPRSRREFLRAGMMGMSGLGLSDLLAARAFSGTSSAPTSLILFWMWGGPSQLETFDPKPEAPSDYRGPFQPIHTKTPGIEICEIFPRLAERMDKMAIVRSLHHDMSSHNDGSIELLTGKTPLVPDPTSTARSTHPDLGMITSRLRGVRSDGVPQYIGIPTQPFMTQPTYLGLSHKAFVTGDPSVEKFAVPNLSLAAGTDVSRLGERGALVQQLDQFRRGLDQSGSLQGTDEFRSTAFTMLTSQAVREAFELERESPEVRQRYGRNLWGQSCLLARRLAEAGTGVVTIDALAPLPGQPVYFSWDDHANPLNGWDLAQGMKLRAEHMDPAISALVDDIHARGLDKQIMVVCVGEFGRTPKLTHVKGYTGRDHWPSAMSALIAGGGIRGGQVIGSTNSKAEYPTERPLKPQDLLATIYRHLQIDQHHAFPDFAGRPIPILGDGSPIQELV